MLPVAAFAAVLQREVAVKSVASDPFAFMYDSDEVFLEQAQPLLRSLERHIEMEEERAIAAESSSPENDLTTPLQGQFQTEARMITPDEVLAYVRDGDTSLLDKLGNDNRQDGQADGRHAREIESLERLYEDSRTDRFIVKYRDSETTGLVGSQMASSKTKPLGRAFRGGTELVTLPEKVNPAEFTNQLRAEGLEEEIEYIQPDFVMSYAGLDLNVKEVEEDDPEGPDNSDEDLGDPDETDAPDDLDGEDDPLGEEEELIEEELLEDILHIQTPVEEAVEVIIALIDTGVDVTHPMLADVLLSGWNFVDGNRNVYDTSSPLTSAHGTHIAGIIAQQGGGNVKVLPLKVFGSHGAYTSDILEAIGYAYAQGVSVVNCSFGSNSYNPALYEAMANSPMLFVASVGNARSDLSDSPVYPAAFELSNVISVASLNADGGFSYYSNYSSSVVDIAARGRDVISALPGGGTGLQSGTSMAAGAVSGVAGLVLSENAAMSADELKLRLTETGDRLVHLQDKVIAGRRLNVGRALAGSVQTQVISIAYEDDFDVNGYQPTQDELWQLYSSSGAVVQVAAGYEHSLVLMADGTVWAWGYNMGGQCGNGTTSASEALTQVTGLTNATHIAAGYEHSIAVKSDGTVWAWGSNYFGQLGDGTGAGRTAPVQVSGLTGAVFAAAGYGYSLTVKSDGTVWAWGDNSYGQLGDGDLPPVLGPVQELEYHT